MIKLVCPECRRENEPERIYCHDCGARLDRSALAKVKGKEEDPKETQRRLRTLMDPRRAQLRQRFFQGSKLILAALGVAVLIQIFRAPDLPPRTITSMLPTQINLDLENAAMDPRMGPLRYTEEQVNAYLAYIIKGKRAALSKYARFERAMAGFGEGYISVTVERSLFGVPLFSSTTYTVTLKDGTIMGTNRGGSLGRLPIHPALMRHAGFLFADLWAALDRERKSIAKLGAMELHPEMIVFTPKQASIQPGAMTPPPPAASPTAAPLAQP